MSLCQVSANKVIEEAKTWLGTPWRHRAMVKGAGVDCLHFVYATMLAVGAIEEQKIPNYPPDWHLHRGDSLLLSNLMRFADKVEKPQLADVIMFNYGRHSSHAALWIGNNSVIHAWLEAQSVVITNIERHPLESRLSGFYRFPLVMQ